MKIDRGRIRNFEWAAATRTNQCRERNEDAFAVIEDGGVFVVADGCGGESNRAARLVVESFETKKPPTAEDAPRDADWMVAAAVAANRSVFRDAQEDPAQQGQGSTLAAIKITRDSCFVLHVGDCRVGRWRDQDFVWLTRDHTLWQEVAQTDVPLGKVAEYKEIHGTVVTRTLGVVEWVDVDLRWTRTRPQDLFVVCTDGLWRALSHEQVGSLLCDQSMSLADRCDRLLAASDASGGHDNATAILVLALGTERHQTQK